MKKIMVVCITDEKQWAKFFDHMSEAEEYRMNCECGCGGYAEVYQYKEETEDECGGYEFMYS